MISRTVALHIPMDLDSFVEQLIEQTNQDECFSVIVEVDKGVADCGFTERLMIYLMESMRAEFKNHPHELTSFLDALGVKDAK